MVQARSERECWRSSKCCLTRAQASTCKLKTSTRLWINPRNQELIQKPRNSWVECPESSTIEVVHGFHLVFLFCRGEGFSGETSTSTSSRELDDSCQVHCLVNPGLPTPSRKLGPNYDAWCRQSKCFTSIVLYCSRALEVPSIEIKKERFTFFLPYHQRLGGDSSSLHHILVNHAHLLRTHSQVGYRIGRQVVVYLYKGKILKRPSLNRQVVTSL
jgi:hypothetical protein